MDPRVEPEDDKGEARLVEQVARSAEMIYRVTNAARKPRASCKTGAIVIVPKLRVARPTDDLEALLPFYCNGLGFLVLHRFENHSGFDGVMLGHANAAYHFEFTRAAGHQAGTAPTPDNLLVFYLPDPVAWNLAVSRMRSAGYAPVPAFNPYWDRAGVTFEDPDGYRVVLQKGDWES